MLTMMCTIGEVMQYLLQNTCKEAMSTFYTLPSNHFHIGYAHNQIGKAYFENLDHDNAKQTLEHMQKLEPCLVQGSCMLNATLWPFKLEIDSCELVQSVISIDKLSPCAWVAAGSCFSSQK